MAKLSKKILLIAIVVIIACTFICSSRYVEATHAMPAISTVDSGSTAGVDNKIENIVGAVLYIAKIVAVGLALIMLTALAMKYMSAAPGDRATIKKHAVVYIVGAIVLFGAAGLLNIIQTFASTNISG